MWTSRDQPEDLNSPATLPSGSANWAKVTTSGISVTGMAVLPPSDSMRSREGLRVVDLDVEDDLVRPLCLRDAARDPGSGEDAISLTRSSGSAVAHPRRGGRTLDASDLPD